MLCLYLKDRKYETIQGGRPKNLTFFWEMCPLIIRFVSKTYFFIHEKKIRSLNGGGGSPYPQPKYVFFL